MDISIVIPAWNLWEVTASCLRSLAMHDGGAQVVVVDNGSTDATRTELEPLGTALFGTRFLRVCLPENRGFAAGCNAGASAASGGALLFLNNDTLATPGWLPPLKEALDTPGTGAVGPLLLYPDGRTQHCGVSFTPLGGVKHLYADFPGDHPAVRRTHPLQAITGAALLLRRADFEAAGGFCEDYANGYEDLELCFSLRQRGLSLAVVSASTVVHAESRTPGRHTRTPDNAALFGQRWGEHVRPDFHQQVALDGYETRLNAQGVSYAVPPPERERALSAQWGGGASERDLRAALHEEPLWREGHLLLGRLLAARNAWPEALEAAGLALRLLPTPEMARLLLRAARGGGQHDRAAAIAASLRPDAAALRACERRVRARLAQAAAWGDPALERICAAWLRTYGGCRNTLADREQGTPHASHHS